MPTLPSTISLTQPADNSGITAADRRNDDTSVQTAVNALIAALAAGVGGQVLTGAGTTLTWGGTYAAYTPTWTSTGTAPAIGNAVVVAQYLQLGKLVHAYGRITFGTTSTFGTGTYSLALPVTASANAVNTSVIGTSQMFDISAGFFGQAAVIAATTTTQRFEYGATYLGVDNSAASTAPWTWANTDILSWNITYEAA